MAIVFFELDPNAASYTDDQIVGKVNTATDPITRAGAVSAAARPIGAGEVTNTELDASAAKANLDAMADLARGYVMTDPQAGEFPIISLQRAANGNLKPGADDVAV